MPRFRWIALTAAILTACTALPRYEAAFSAIDGNQDQVVEWHEFKAYFPSADPKTFLQADHDKDGNITREEWQSFIATQGS
jgi:hypothetical protein